VKGFLVKTHLPKTQLLDDADHLAGRARSSLTCRRCREQEFRCYGIATVRLYVGAVKRVALPIVSQAINPPGARLFHRQLSRHPLWSL